ncbi:MAG: hypothetical protein QOD65_3147, partial [Gaiellales bacterium]|nr:hypothetical protein [Gaiellales bacterium]
MDCGVQQYISLDSSVHYHPGMTSQASLTAKGAATRDRIVEAAADLILARGVGGTSL